MAHSASRFPTAIPRTRFVQPAQLHPEREITRMKLSYRGIYSGATTPPLASQTGCTDMIYVSMTNCYSPGTAVSGLTTFPSMGAATGMTSLGALYTNWQVRGCKISVRIHQYQATPGTGNPQVADMDWVMVPISSVLTATITSGGFATLPFDALKMMPGASKPIRLNQNYDGGSVGVGYVNCFSSPQRVEASPGYLTGSTSYGIFPSTIPSGTAGFIIAGSHIQTYSIVPYFEFEFNIEYSVLVWGRQFTPLVGEPSPPGDHISVHHTAAIDDEDMDETKFDTIPELSTLRVTESKEEKKSSPFTPTHPFLLQCAEGARPLAAGGAVVARSAHPLSLATPRSPSVK